MLYLGAGRERECLGSAKDLGCSGVIGNRSVWDFVKHNAGFFTGLERTNSKPIREGGNGCAV